MSWKNIVKSTFKRNIYRAYKEAIQNYYESNDLGNFTLDELHSQSKDYAYEYLMNHPNINSRAVGSWLKAKSRRILPNILTALEREGVIVRVNARGRGGVFKSWDSTLKGSARSKNRKLVEDTVKVLIANFVEGKDEFTSTQLKQYIIDNLKNEHIKRNSVDGKASGPISAAPTRYINNFLDKAMKTKIPIWVKKHGLTNTNLGRRELRGDKPYTTFRKSDSWESMTDSMIAEGKLFEAIYTAILQKFKFSAPSKEKVVAYLNANYERHPLFSNKWSTKSEGEGQ